MRKTIITTLLLAASPVLQAAEELSTDSTQMKYERKALLQVPDIGLKSRTVKLPARFCPHKAKSCVPLGLWEFKIDQELEDQASRQIMGRLTGKRYDLIRFLPGKMEMKTLFETIDVPSKVGDFRFETGKPKAFAAEVTKYLNVQVAPMMSKLLVKAKDARYQEMDNKEKDTFLATIAKEQSVPADMIARLLNSAFVFSEYVDQPSGSIEIREDKVKRDGKKVTEYSANVSVNANLYLGIHRFNAENNQFEAYKVIRARSGSVSGGAQLYPFRPTNSVKINSVFRNSFSVAAKAAALAANIDLKKDDNFAIFSTVDSIEGDYIASSIGEAEDLRIDAPYYLMQNIDGKNVKTGWAKARTVADKDLLKKAPGEYQSQFWLVKGDVEYKDQMREHPWSGVLWYLGGGQSYQELLEIDGQDASGGGEFAGVLFGTRMDLGYLFNAKFFSESWFDMNVFIGVGGAALNSVALGNYNEPAFAQVDFDWVKRKHLGHFGLYWAYKLGWSFNALAASHPINADGLNVYSHGLHGGVQLGYLFTPNFEFFINTDGFLPASTRYIIGTDGQEGVGVVTPGYSINAGLSFHMKSIGGFASMMR